MSQGYGVIYKYTNKINGKVYIGQTVQTMARRHNDHLQDARKKRHSMPFHNAIRKYGIKSFDKEILFTAFDNESLSESEAYFIQLYKSQNKLLGYNIKNGGGNGKHAAETVDKIKTASFNMWAQSGFKEKFIVKHRYWTKERCKEEALKYTCVRDWKQKSPGSYVRAGDEGIIKECTGHMIQLIKPAGTWNTLEACKEDALKYLARKVWSIKSSGAYQSAVRNKWLKECCAHMPKYAPRSKKCQ
jgi:group I intron endonuclease